MKTDVDRIIQAIDTLTPIPAVTTRIMELANDPDSSMRDLADILRYDAEITANLLKMCNSAYFSFPVQVDSVHQAVSLLGLNIVIELVLMTHTGQNMLKAQRGYGLERGELWKNSVATALVAKSIAEEKHIADHYRVYTACLLKDIGKVIIESHVGKAIKHINHLVAKKGYGFDQAEEEAIGINHATLGGMIAKQWNFSPKMAFMIGHHHLDTEEARKDMETSIVYLADTVSLMVGIGIGADGLAYKVYEDIFDDLGISENNIRPIMSAFKINLHKADRLLSSLY